MLPENRGATARNAGVRAAATPYVAFSDDDSWWDAGALPKAARVLAAHPRLGLLVARIRLDGDGRTDPVSRKMASASAGRDPGLPGPAVIGFPACAAVVRREAFLRVGGFDELLFFGGEESLLALDLAAAGWGLAYVASVTAVHDPSKRRHTPPDRWSLHRRNDVLVTWMRLSYPRALRSTRKLAAQAVADAAARRALRGLVVRLPAALARRRRVPSAVEGRVRALHELE